MFSEPPQLRRLPFCIMIRKCYPQGKEKAFSVSYDDGVLQDIRLVELMNRYGIRGTFNLNSSLMESGFTWLHENGMQVSRLTPAQAAGLYDGHEIASHTLTHPYMHDLTEAEILYQMSEDKRALEEMFSREVEGFAVPFEYYSPLIAHCAKACGFLYARMSEFTGTYCPWQDRYYWKCGMFHLQPELMEYVSKFLTCEEELALCQIVGHSYDLDAEDLWDTTEEIFRSVAARQDIWLATNVQIVGYLMAMSALEVADGCAVNRSDRELWLKVDGRIVALQPGEFVKENAL